MSEVTVKGAHITTETVPTTRKSSGLTFRRFFTKPGVSPYDEIEWERRTAQITDAQGKAIFEQKDVEVPKDWSMTATNIVARNTCTEPSARPSASPVSAPWSLVSPRLSATGVWLKAISGCTHSARTGLLRRGSVWRQLRSSRTLFCGCGNQERKHGGCNASDAATDWRIENCSAHGC